MNCNFWKWIYLINILCSRNSYNFLSSQRHGIWPNCLKKGKCLHSFIPLQLNTCLHKNNFATICSNKHAQKQIKKFQTCKSIFLFIQCLLMLKIILCKVFNHIYKLWLHYFSRTILFFLSWFSKGKIKLSLRT